MDSHAPAYGAWLPSISTRKRLRYVNWYLYGMTASELIAFLPEKEFAAFARQYDSCMSDIFTKRKRSEVMSRIRGSGNKATELRLIPLFRANGITGWRRGSKLPGKPDFVFPRLRVAVFVDGCFWHGCPKHATQPKTNAGFWRKKIARNQQRDREVGRVLRRAGWRVIRVWEHGLRRKDEARTVRRLTNCLQPGL